MFRRGCANFSREVEVSFSRVARTLYRKPALLQQLNVAVTEQQRRRAATESLNQRARICRVVPADDPDTGSQPSLNGCSHRKPAPQQRTQACTELRPELAIRHKTVNDIIATARLQHCDTLTDAAQRRLNMCQVPRRESPCIRRRPAAGNQRRCQQQRGTRGICDGGGQLSAPDLVALANAIGIMELLPHSIKR